MSKESEIARKRQSAHDIDVVITNRLEALYPEMRAAFGTVDDGIPTRVREVAVPFFVLYSDAWKAHSDGLINSRDWQGLGPEFLYWSQKPVAREAWNVLREQTWTTGFADHVDETIKGASAYPSLEAKNTSNPRTMNEAEERLKERSP